MHARAQSVLMLIMLTLASYAQEQKSVEPKSLPEDRATDTYDVYDAALPSPIWGQPYDGAKYYIIDRSIKPNPGWQPEKCMHPPDELRTKVKEMFDDLEAQADSYKLESRFKLAKPYQFVSSDPLQRRKGMDGGVPPSAQIIQLGIVSFSKDRSLASVVVWSSGGSRWKVFTRGKKGWEEQPWSGCGAIF
jgi:hypothetical protein